MNVRETAKLCFFLSRSALEAVPGREGEPRPRKRKEADEPQGTWQVFGRPCAGRIASVPMEAA